MTPTELDTMLDCRSRILDALLAQMENRPAAPDTWIDDERLAVTERANQWAHAHRGTRLVTVDDVERIEHLAMGHVDYASKLALYVAEMVFGMRERA